MNQNSGFDSHEIKAGAEPVVHAGRSTESRRKWLPKRRPLLECRRLQCVMRGTEMRPT